MGVDDNEHEEEEELGKEDPRKKGTRNGDKGNDCEDAEDRKKRQDKGNG